MTADTVGGVWTYVVELAQAIAAHGVATTIATMGPKSHSGNGATLEAQLPPSDHIRVVHGDFRLEWMEDPWHDVAAAGDWLLELARSEQAEMVHFNNYTHAALPWRIPTLIVAHSCVYSWFAAVHDGPPPPRFERYREEVRRGLAAANCVTAPTRRMLQWLQRFYGPFAASDPIPNGRRVLAAPSGAKDPLILTAGRLWDEAKNVAALDEVATQLEWPVYAAGPTQHPTGGPVPARGLKLLGVLNEADLGSWFAKAAIFALPARYEPFGLSILEAAHAGCALVLGDTPTLREVWGMAAVYVPPDDRVALRGALELLMHDTTLRAEYSARAQERARRYTPERMAAGYARLYGHMTRGQMCDDPELAHAGA